MLRGSICVKPFENAIDENLGYIKVPEFGFRL